MTLLLGCVADDFTGATDLGNTLVKAGNFGAPDFFTRAFRVQP